MTMNAKKVIITDLLPSRRSFIFTMAILIILAVFSGCLSNVPDEEERTIIQITKYMTENGEAYTTYYEIDNRTFKRIFKQETDIILFSNKTRLVLEQPNTPFSQYVLYINQSDFKNDCKEIVYGS